MIVTEYEVGPGAHGVTLDADGAAWTSLTGRGELARVGPDGQVSHVSLDSAQSRPMVLARGPDDAIWFSRGDGQIGRATRCGARSTRLTPSPGSPGTAASRPLRCRRREQHQWALTPGLRPSGLPRSARVRSRVFPGRAD